MIAKQKSYRIMKKFFGQLCNWILTSNPGNIVKEERERKRIAKV